jgi:probable rRNA maturation factor
MSSGPKRSSVLQVNVVDARGRGLRVPGLAAWLKRVAPARAAGEVTIAVVPDARSRALNQTYRGKDAATDVLSFPSGLQTPGSGLRGRPQSGVRSPKPVAFLGDIVIARGVAKRQARAAGHSESTEWRVLALHGLLHLVGYDHETDHGRMARVEARLRRRGGLHDGLIERGDAR